MPLSIFFSLSLPRNQDGESKMAMLLLDAKELAAMAGLNVGPLRVLTALDCARAQAEMNSDFSFARTACTPPGADRHSPLGTVPEKAVYFRVSGRDEGGIDVGVAQYTSNAKLNVYTDCGKSVMPYDGRWYYWTFYDEYTVAELNALKAILSKARELGFETTLLDEAE